MLHTVHSTLLTHPYCAMDRWVDNPFASLVSEGVPVCLPARPAFVRGSVATSGRVERKTQASQGLHERIAKSRCGSTCFRQWFFKTSTAFSSDFLMLRPQN